jgi:hypothetical protein
MGSPERRTRCPSQDQRTRLGEAISAVLRAGELPPQAHEAGLTLIGWRARRLPGDGAATE